MVALEEAAVARAVVAVAVEEGEQVVAEIEDDKPFCFRDSMLFFLIPLNNLVRILVRIITLLRLPFKLQRSWLNAQVDLHSVTRFVP